jgi:hypothetical protein
MKLLEKEREINSTGNHEIPYFKAKNGPEFSHICT